MSHAAPPPLKKQPVTAGPAPATTKSLEEAVVTKQPSPSPKPVKRWHVPLKAVWPLLWVALWAAWVGWSALQATRAVTIPEDLEVSVQLPDVNQRALNEIRMRQAAGIIVPSQNNTPRANPFQ